MPGNETAYKDEAAEVMEHLGSGPPAADVLDRLYRLGVWSRGSILPRGTLTQPAIGRSPDQTKIDALLSAFSQTRDEETRRKIALVLGQWGGPECLDRLAEILKNGADAVTRLYCLSAIRSIGGPKAAEAIAEALTMKDTDVQEAAVSALLDLATGGAESDLDSATNVSLSFDSKQAIDSSLSNRLVMALERMKTGSAPMAARFRAADALDFLTRSGLLTLASPTEVKPSSFGERMKALASAMAVKLPLAPPTVHFGEPDEATPTARILGVNFTPRGESTEKQEIVSVEIHPLTSDQPDLLFFLSGNNGVVFAMKIPDENFPGGVAEIRVRAKLPDNTFVDAEGRPRPTLTRAGGIGIFEFAIPEEFLIDWCGNPQFELSEARPDA